MSEKIIWLKPSMKSVHDSPVVALALTPDETTTLLMKKSVKLNLVRVDSLATIFSSSVTAASDLAETLLKEHAENGAEMLMLKIEKLLKVTCEYKSVSCCRRTSMM